MPKRIALSTLNASTMDILNTIRANSSLAYQSSVPVVENAKDIPVVGEILYGYPALANEFISSLINRIALVKVRSATFNNAYKALKKGYLQNGETVEEVFVNIAKVREFSSDKAPAREMRKTLADVRSAFHAMNWRVQYPVSIPIEDLRQAFLSMDGVQDMIARMVDSLYLAAEYDEFLLFKYLIIKAISHGKMYPQAVDTSDIKNAGIAFRGISNTLPFLATKYNEAGVTTATKKEDQYIFMDAMFNATYDVNVLASAFNMEKADFMGKLMLIDNWTTFDNDRWADIRSASDMVEEVTEEELTLMGDVVAVLADEEWFQIYDNLAIFTEDQIAAGLYWNYFYTVWKTVSSSPFSNAVVFVSSESHLPAFSGKFVVSSLTQSDDSVIVTIVPDPDEAQVDGYHFIQTDALTALGVAVHPYGGIIVPNDVDTLTLVCEYDGDEYTAEVTVAELEVGGSIEMTTGE